MNVREAIEEIEQSVYSQNREPLNDIFKSSDRMEIFPATPPFSGVSS